MYYLNTIKLHILQKKKLNQGACLGIGIHISSGRKNVNNYFAETDE